MSSPELVIARSRHIGWGFSWPLLVATASYLLVLTHAPRLLIDGDVYWHVTAGRWIIEHGLVPAFDPFSYTARDAPWTAHEWLSEVVFAGAHALVGWAGMVIITGAAFAAALAILNRFLLSRMEPIYALLFTALAASLLIQHLLARPHTLVAPLLVSWGVALVGARERDLAPPWRVVWLMLLWANLHGSFVLGMALALAFAAEAVIAAEPGAERRRVGRSWCAFLVVATVASLATPFGPEGWLFALQLDRMPFALSVIGEWQPLNFQVLQPLELGLVIAAGAILARGLRLPPVRIVLLLGLLHLALKHARHSDVLALLAPVIIATPFAEQWFSRRDASRQAALLDDYFLALASPARTAAVVAVVALLGGVSWMLVKTAAIKPADDATPESAVLAVQRAGIRSPVLNAYEFGGYLIYSGIPPYIDGRADLYGDAFLKSYYEAVQLSKPELLPQILESYRIGWTLLIPGMPAVALLDHLPGWRRLYADKVAVVHVRDPQASHRSTTQTQ